MTYSLHLIDPALDVRAIRITRETVRRGRKIGFSRSLIVDAEDAGRLIAVTSGTGVTLGEAPPGFRAVDLPPDLPEVPLPPLPVVFGAHRDADGWRLPELTTRLASTSASLHIGPIHVVFEAAANEAALAAMNGDPGAVRGESGCEGGESILQIEDWEVHFTSPGRKGPFLVQTDAWQGPAGRLLSRFALLDEGNADVVVATGTAAFRVAGHAHG